MRNKILVHIIAITCLLIGIIFIHVIENNPLDYYYFFNIPIYRVVILDLALILIGIAFFIEFYMSFKPIEYKKEVEE